MKRISRDDLNMEIARVIALRGTCERGRVGAVIAKDGRIISTGYAGAPAGLPHCTEAGCLIGADGGCIRTSHAEAGAIAFAARKGIATEGATLYVTLAPCQSCAKLIINAGIERVVYGLPYRDSAGVDLLVKAGIEITQQLRKE